MSIRVVLVDDNLDLVSLLSDFLSLQEDIAVVGTAANGLDAVHLIEKVKPEIVILDIIMPYLGGIGVLERISNLNIPDPPQFIVLSAVGQTDILQIALSLGVSYYMIKPFDMKELVLIIRKLKRCKDAHKENEHQKIIDEADIKELFGKIGVLAHLKGYHYLVRAIHIMLEDPSAINAVTRKIYSEVAKQYGSTPKRVERAIRNTIESTWNKGDIDTLNELFGSDILGEKAWPSNSEFIIKISNLFWKRKNEKISI